MGQLSGFPSAEIRFDRDGNVAGSDADARTLALDPAVTDLVVIAHGWNNDDQGARELFARLAASLRAAVVARGPLPAGRAIGVLGVIWPSKKFDDAVVATGGGGALALGSGTDEDAILAQIQELRPVFPTPAEQAELDAAATLVPHLEDRATARAEFADRLRSLVRDVPTDPEDGPADFLGKPGETLMRRLSLPVAIAPPQGTRGRAAGSGGAIEGPGDGAGHAAGLPTLFGGVLGAARNLLNYTTFYEMKERAGRVGGHGLAGYLASVRSQRRGLRVHLAGHSFGARLVSAAAAGLPHRSVATLTLLQAAFSHFGLSADWNPDDAGPQAGAFAAVLSDPKVRGPVLITHTANDTAVGIAYAIASRLAGQVAAAVGDAEDVFGGLGRNGAQRAKGTVTARLLDVGGTYSWQPAVANNLLADEFVRDHGDVTGPQVGHAMLTAFMTT